MKSQPIHTCTGAESTTARKEHLSSTDLKHARTDQNLYGFFLVSLLCPDGLKNASEVKSEPPHYLLIVDNFCCFRFANCPLTYPFW